MKTLLIIILLIVVSTQPVLAKGSFGSRSTYRSAPKTYTAPKVNTKINTSAKQVPVKAQPVRAGASSWNPFAPNFWFWMFLFGTVSHNNKQVVASSSATLTPTGVKK